MADGPDEHEGPGTDDGSLPPPDAGGAGSAGDAAPPPPPADPSAGEAAPPPPGAPPPPDLPSPPGDAPPPPPDATLGGDAADDGAGGGGRRRGPLIAVGVVVVAALALGGLVAAGVIDLGGDDDAVTIAPDDEDEPPATDPPTTDPPTTDPPTTDPPTTDPPTTEPVTTDPADEEDASRDVLLEPIGEPGPDPFTTPVAPDPDETLEVFAARGTPPPDESADPEAEIERPDPTAELVQRDTHLEIDGATAGLYGGTLDTSSCDPDQLVEFLAENPDLGTAWADVHDITLDEIPEFVAELTPVNLGADTRVLNHGFDGEAAVPRHSVLQRGSAVLVDDRGVPRANCYCGNPLLESEPAADDVFTGESWDAFDERATLVVTPSEEPIEMFTLTDVATGDPFDRPAATTGDADQSFLEALAHPDFTPGVDCGLIPDPGDLGDAEFLVDDIRMMLSGDAQTCEIATEVTVEFMRMVGMAFLDSNVTFPYRPNVLGWQCSTGPFLTDQAAGGEFFGCVDMDSRSEIRLVPG